MNRPVPPPASGAAAASRAPFVPLALATLAAVVLVVATASYQAPEADAQAKPKAAPAAAGSDTLRQLEAAVKKDSTNARTQYRLALGYLDADRPLEAARHFRKAVEIDPKYVEAWVNLGAAEDASGHSLPAREAYRNALALRPADEIAMCRLASSYYAVGFKDSAMATLRETIKAHPRSHCAYFTMGVAFADASMFREAIRNWQKVVEYAPTSPEAESAKESIRLLKEYLGADSVAVAAGKPGAPHGAGGPAEPIKGGDMKGATGAAKTGKK